MDRKTANIITEMKHNSRNLEEFKSTQLMGSDSTQMLLMSTGGDYNTSAVLTPNQLSVFWYQVFDSTAMIPKDAAYNNGVINVYVDTPPPTDRYLGINSPNVSAPFANPLLIVGVDAIEYENGHYWAFQIRNIDNVNHTVYTKGFLISTLNPNALFWGYGVS